jgi:carbon-monoxide dehydrogenase small subunit
METGQVDPGGVFVEEETFRIKVNGKKYTVQSRPDEPLVWVLRDKLRLTGTKWGCGEGACGACTILIDNKPVRSCMMKISDVSPRQRILTVEGLARNGKLKPLQKAFIKHTAFACGFCTPGMLMRAMALLRENPDPSREEIIEYMNGNVCRCGGYLNIVEAIESVTRSKGRK